MTQPVPEYNGCPWPLDPACFTEEWEAVDQPTKDRAVAYASATLHRLTGYRVGGCPMTVRPCVKSCWEGLPTPDRYTAWSWMYPHVGLNGQWVNSCGCTSDCSCTSLCEVVLPEPVGEVQEVVVDGTILAEMDYRVDGNHLVWVGDGECPWPACQDMTKPDTEPNTFSVTFLNSYPVDGMGAYAAAVLAMEFAQACIGNKCRLPATVTSITRQGVTFDIPTGAFPTGTTGIREVDAFIALWNPRTIRQRATVWSPDLHSPRVMR